MTFAVVGCADPAVPAEVPEGALCATFQREATFTGFEFKVNWVTYDHAGDPVRVETDSALDGSIDEYLEKHYAGRRLQSEERFVGVGWTVDVDDVRSGASLMAPMLSPGRVRAARKPAAEYQLLERKTYSYEREGRIDAITIDAAMSSSDGGLAPPDGQPDSRVQFTYKDGLIESETRISYAGQVLSVTSYTYAADGRVTSKVTAEPAPDGSAEPESVEQADYAYNDDGTIASIQLARKLPSIPDPLFCTMVHRHDGGLLRVVEGCSRVTAYAYGRECADEVELERALALVGSASSGGAVRSAI